MQPCNYKIIGDDTDGYTEVLMRNLTKGDVDEICDLMNWWVSKDNRLLLLRVEVA